MVCASAELAPGCMREARLGRAPIVVIRTADGSLHALAGRCLHQGAPLARGRLLVPPAPADRVGAYELEGGREVVKCPWHGYEYDVRTGTAAFDGSRRLQRYRVWDEGGNVVAAR